MKFGVVFPQTEFGSDPAAIRDFAQTAESLGYSHVIAYDHVLGANPDRPGGWSGPYTYQDSFMEPFVLFSHMAAITTKLRFFTGVIILPQRQTALVAKQAATLDRLSGGRLRLGVGLGWNQVEYTALGQDFHTRGRRVEEQVALIRRLWSEPLVTFEGEWHSVPDAGLNPLPSQARIPIWFGGRSEPAMQRAARIGDGWISIKIEVDEVLAEVASLERLLEAEGRSREDFGYEVRLNYGEGKAEAWQASVEQYEAVRPDYISLLTMRAGLESAADHVAAMRRFAEKVGPAAGGA